jgi:hypothetical protein
MNKKYIFLPVLLLCGLFIASCTSNDSPVTPSPVGSIYVTSTPATAQIWLDGTLTGKVTPDTLTNVSVGSHTVILKLTDYFSDTVTVTVQEGITTTLTRTLVSDKSVTNYGPIQIWETVGTSASQPSGIILRSGRASSITSGGKDSVDVYYSSNGYVVATAFNINSRPTSFYVGSANNLTDGVASPPATVSWLTQVNDTQNNYFFLFDADLHYSKMIITERGGGTVGNPAWIKVQWLYNNKPNDQRF